MATPEALDSLNDNKTTGGTHPTNSAAPARKLDNDVVASLNAEGAPKPAAEPGKGFRDIDDTEAIYISASEEFKENCKGQALTREKTHNNKLQAAMKRLSSWPRRRSSDQHQLRKPIVADPGSSPPAFLLDLAIRWSGLRSASDLKAATIGEKVALWIIESPELPAKMVLYDPNSRTLDQPVLAIEPGLAEGFTFTPRELPEQQAGAFLFGGRTETGLVKDECWFFSASTKQWTLVKSEGAAPTARCHHAAAFSCKSGSLYIYSGENDARKAIEGTHRLVKGNWEKLSSNREPPPRSHHSLCVVSDGKEGDILFTFGGLVSGKENNDLWSMAAESGNKCWKSVDDAAGKPPSERHGHSAIVSGERFFIFGGLRKHWLGWPVLLFDMFAYDRDVNSWFEIPLESPLASELGHGFAIAEGDLSSIFHIFEAGSSGTYDGAVYDVGAVCSTLDISVFSTAIGDMKMVMADTQSTCERIRSDLYEIIKAEKMLEQSVSFLLDDQYTLAGTNDSITECLMRLCNEMRDRLELVQTLEVRVKNALAEGVARESSIRKRMEVATTQLEVLRRGVFDSADTEQTEDQEYAENSSEVH